MSDNNDKLSPFPWFNKESMALADEQLGIVVLMKGASPIGDPMWYYLSVKPTKMEEFYNLDPSAPFDMNDYGYIIVHGIGEEPPEDVKAEIESVYGADHNLEENISKLAQEIYNDDLAKVNEGKPATTKEKTVKGKYTAKVQKSKRPEAT